MEPILSIKDWATNAELIADVALLGHLKDDWRTLDPTWGHGTFWELWRPMELVGSDLDPARSPIVQSVDFTMMPWEDGSFDAVVFDPPYKLNGTPDATVDKRYGVHEYTPWRDRMALIRGGLRECARVLGDGNLLLKCMDQVCSGKKRWQTIEFTKLAEELGLGLVDRFDMTGHHRPQPAGRTQKHSAGVASTLLVFRRGWASSDLTARYHDEPELEDDEGECSI